MTQTWNFILREWHFCVTRESLTWKAAKCSRNFQPCMQPKGGSPCSQSKAMIVSKKISTKPPPSYPVCIQFVIKLSSHLYLRVLFLLHFSAKILMHFLSAHACYTPQPSHYAMLSFRYYIPFRPTGLRYNHSFWCKESVTTNFRLRLFISAVLKRPKPGMSNWGSPEGHMGHICVVMRATHDN